MIVVSQRELTLDMATAKSSTPGQRFTHIDLENWRNFTRVQVELQRRAFLVGPNASGKSNFLDVFRFLHDIVSVGGGLQEAVRRRGGVSRLRCLAARRYPNLVIRVEIGNDAQPHGWSYELQFTQDNRQRPKIEKEVVLREGSALLNRPDKEDRRDAERLTQTYLEQVNVNQAFREVAEFFGSVRYRHIVPQLIRDPDRSVDKKDDPFGGDFLEQIARTQERTRSARMRHIERALQVAVPQLKEIKFERDERGRPHLHGKYVHWRPQGAWQSEQQLSDGTLRLLGLLWTILDGSGPLLLEEPELSLHPEVIRYLPQMLARAQRRAGRQVLISTHSSELLRDEGIGLHEVLLLQPEAEGTVIRPASEFVEIRALLEGGVNLAEAVIPRTAPANARQLALFGD